MTTRKKLTMEQMVEILDAGCKALRGFELPSLPVTVYGSRPVLVNTCTSLRHSDDGLHVFDGRGWIVADLEETMLDWNSILTKAGLL
jgi:hypothetical protein